MEEEERFCVTEDRDEKLWAVTFIGDGNQRWNALDAMYATLNGSCLSDINTCAFLHSAVPCHCLYRESNLPCHGVHRRSAQRNRNITYQIQKRTHRHL